MSKPIERVVIVGAGQAGAECAVRLRSLGFAGEVTLIGDEPLAPYQRPPLSKKYLSGDADLDDLLLRPAESYEEIGVALRTGVAAAGIDRAQKTVSLSDGAALAYDALVLATGASPRRLPIEGFDLPGVLAVRTTADVDALRPLMAPGRRMAIVGAGFIGLETAAVARGMGLEVTIVEAGSRPLSRVTSPEVSGFFLDVHASAGVSFHLSQAVERIGGAGRVEFVELSGGARLPADIVLVGAGAAPAVELAERAGLAVDNGVQVGLDMRTSDPDIFALGDCACRAHPRYGKHVRLESVHNALETARLAAAAIAGAPPPGLEAPWFWSDQYELKLQIVGLLHGHDSLIVRGDPATRSFAVFYLRGEEIIAADAVNAPAEYLGAKRLIERNARVARAALMDMSQPFRKIVADAVG